MYERVSCRGGGGTSICIHIGYVPRERPPFSALNFRPGAYHFHKFQKKKKKSVLEHHHHFQNFFNFNPFHRLPWLAQFRRVPFSAPRVSPTRHGISERVPRESHAKNESILFRSPHFKLKTAQARSGAPHFKLKTAQARSGAPHFHARPGARSGALANVSLCRGTYLPKVWGSNPPPPPPTYNSTWKSIFLCTTHGH